MQNQERETGREWGRESGTHVAWLVQLPPPTSGPLPRSVYNCAALSRRAGECISCAALYANFKAHLCGASDDVGDEKPKKEEKQQKRKKDEENLCTIWRTNKRLKVNKLPASFCCRCWPLMRDIWKHLSSTPAQTHTHTWRIRNVVRAAGQARLALCG